MKSKLTRGSSMLLQCGRCTERFRWAEMRHCPTDRSDKCMRCWRMDNPNVRPEKDPWRQER